MLVIDDGQVKRVVFPCSLVKYRDSYPMPPWAAYCDGCTDSDGAPISTHGYTEQEIEDWFYEHTIQKGDNND